MSNIWRSIVLLVIGLVIYSVDVYAQLPKVNSPYSRFGLGDILDQRFAVSQATGFTNAYHDYYHLNLQNPASLAHLTATAFETSLYAQRSNWEDDANNNHVSWSGNLGYLALGFPLYNPINQVLDREIKPITWGMAFNLQPYSVVGYDVETTESITDIGATTTQFRGNGGTYKVQWGNGIRYKQISAGINLGYVFGNIENNRTVTFNDIEASFQNRFLDDFNVYGFIWDAGFQYDILLESKDTRFKKSITIGVTGNSNHTINTSTNQFYERFNLSYNISPQDTILNTTGVKGDATLPASFGVGVIYSIANKLKLGVNYDYSAWSNYRNDAKPEDLSNGWKISVGGEFIPDYSSYNNFGKRITYQLGAFYGRDPRSIGGEQINQIGVSFGMGLPISLARQQVSFVNFAFELGRNGGNTVIKENYARLTVGFTLNNNSWFYKRKFN